MYHKAVFHLRSFGYALRDFAPMLLAAIALGLAAGPALAELPTVVTPDGATSGDYVAVIGGYVKKGLLLLGLIVMAISFYYIAVAGLSSFNQWRNGKAEGMFVVANVMGGAAILITIAYLLTEAATVM